MSCEWKAPTERFKCETLERVWEASIKPNWSLSQLRSDIMVAESEKTDEKERIIANTDFYIAYLNSFQTNVELSWFNASSENLDSLSLIPYLLEDVYRKFRIWSDNIEQPELILVYGENLERLKSHEELVVSNIKAWMDQTNEFKWMSYADKEILSRVKTIKDLSNFIFYYFNFDIARRIKKLFDIFIDISGKLTSLESILERDPNNISEDEINKISWETFDFELELLYEIYKLDQLRIFLTNNNLKEHKEKIEEVKKYINSLIDILSTLKDDRKSLVSIVEKTNWWKQIEEWQKYYFIAKAFGYTINSSYFTSNTIYTYWNKNTPKNPDKFEKFKID